MKKIITLITILSCGFIFGCCGTKCCNNCCCEDEQCNVDCQCDGNCDCPNCDC